MKAIIMTGTPGEATLVQDRQPPALRPGYLLVDVKAVALNPTDWKHVDNLNTKNHLLGCDYAGVVAQTGTGYVTPWRVGDRICGFTNGANMLQAEDGAFAEQVVVRADVQMRIPDSMGFEQAATLGVGVITCGQGLVEKMGLRRFSEWQPDGQGKGEGEVLLVYGGSSATGSLGVQFATLAGYRVITTCSPRNFAFVKGLGAVEAFDYNDPECAAKIRAFANNDLRYVWDTISTPASGAICTEVIAPGGRFGYILFGGELKREDVKNSFSLGYLALGEPTVKGGFRKDDCTEDFEWMRGWVAEVTPLLAEGKIKPHPAKVGQGLEGVFEGMKLLKEDKVSGQKLVYVL